MTTVISLTVADANDTKSVITVYTSDDVGATVADLLADYVTVLWDAIRPLISGVLVDASVAVKMDISGLANNTPSVLSDVEEKAIFTMRPCGGLRASKLSLPTIKESVFVNSGAGEEVDLTNADVIAFFAVMESGVVDGGINATDSHGTDICKVIYGEQSFGGK